MFHVKHHVVFMAQPPRLPKEMFVSEQTRPWGNVQPCLLKKLAAHRGLRGFPKLDVPTREVGVSTLLRAAKKYMFLVEQHSAGDQFDFERMVAHACRFRAKGRQSR